MKKIGVLILYILISVHSYAQQREVNMDQFSVSGKIFDNETKQALEYATIIFTTAEGNTLTGGITDSNGQFDINVSEGTYNISIEFIAFKTITYKDKIITDNTNLGSIFLEFNTENLDEVEIIAERSTVEIRLDKKIYNVGKDMTVKGGTASDVLDNVPSVTVDVEGNVSLRGNGNVRILVNGKPSGMVGLSGTDGLRQLPADAIEKVEVITSPSARYDAEGTAGILNIILRKGKAQGFNGSVIATIGIPENYGGSANLNYRTKKVNIFSNTGYNFSNSPGNSFSNVTYLNQLGAATNYRNEVRDYDREGNQFNTRIGMEYFITDKSSITGSVMYRDSNGDNISTNNIDEFDINKLLTNITERIEAEDEIRKSTEYSLNFTQKFNEDGHLLTLDFQYEKNTENEGATISDSDIFPDLTINDPERNSTDEISKDILLKGDYVLPIGENAQFEFGFKADISDLSSDYLVEEFDAVTKQYVNNTNFSNTLDFERNVYALYAQYGRKINKFSYLLGLRSETTDRKINLIQTNEIYNKNFTELFPTVNLGIEFNESESLTLGYSRRLRRPHHWYMHPFESRTSETYIRKGNINLDPTFTNSFDLGYLKRWDGFILNSSIYYQHAINNIEWVQTESMRDLDGDGIEDTLVIIRNPVNLSSQDRYGFEFTANYNPFKWWKISNSFNFFKSVTEGEYNGVSYDSDDTNWFTRLTSRITLPGKIDWQTNGMYMGPSEGAQSKRKGMFSVNLAFSKDILKENGTLSLNVSDLFNSRKRSSTSYSPNTVTEGEFQWRERQIRLNFTYRFNQKKKRERSQNNNRGGEGEMFKA